MNMYEIPLSVIIPTYNRPQFLPRMLDSVLAQTFRDYELILINNGSTDDLTEEQCQAYAQKDNRIRLFSLKENEGPSRARNLGIEESKGEYIIHLDDDDYCEPNHLSMLMELSIKHDADIAVSGCVDEIDGIIRPKHAYEGTYVWDGAQAVSEFLKREKFHAAPATKLYRKTLFNDVRYLQGRLIDDIHVTYKLFARGSKAVAHGVPTYRFRKFEGNTTSFLDKDIVWPELLEEYFLMQQERVAYISALVPEESAHVRYAAWSYMISMVEKIHLGRGQGCQVQLAYMVEQLRENQQEFMQAPWMTERERRLMNAHVLNGSISTQEQP